MKTYIQITIAALFILTLSACAVSDAERGTRVKCPACGYEFNVGMEG